MIRAGNIEPTISVAEASQTCWDVTVVGAGPAGSMTALLAARAGLRTLLLDRTTFPRWKVCGCCLNGLALKMLETADLKLSLERLRPPELKQVTIAAGNTSATLALPAGWALSRTAFDAKLIQEAIAAGASFLSNTQAQWAAPSDEFAQIQIQDLKGTATITSRTTVAADGLTASFTRQIPGVRIERSASSLIGAGALLRDDGGDYQRGVIYLGVGRAGYVGLVRLEDDNLDIAAAIRPSAIRTRQSLGDAAASILREAHMPLPRKLIATRWQGTPPLTRLHRLPPTPRLFVVGDAAEYVEPFTGEGMGWALASAAALQPLLKANVNGDGTAVSQWPSVRRKILGPRQWRCKVLTRGLRSPWLTRTGLSLVKHFPSVAAWYLREVNTASKAGAPSLQRWGRDDLMV